MIGSIQANTASNVNTILDSSNMTEQTLELAELAQEALAIKSDLCHPPPP
jgi:methyl-accepting chemotaxis protein